MSYSPPLTTQRTLSARALELIASGLSIAANVDAVTLETGESRRYLQLVETPDWNAWLIAWGPSGALAPHDHGGSRGIVHVVGGRLLETYIDKGVPHSWRTRAADAGESLDVPAHRIHEVWNPGPEVAYSVHVYSPPLTEMEFFDLQEAEAAVKLPA